MIVSELRRTWCRVAHVPRSLRAALVGGGSVACRSCGAGFVDLEDAGALMLVGHERQLTWGWMAAQARKPHAEPTFAAVTWTVLKRGAEIRKGRAA